MDIKFEKVLERDIDLLIINNFSKGLLIDLFLSKINKKDYIIESIEHSLKTDLGENDITIILSNGNNKIALLIEDKIAAPAMEEQADRYNKRGDKLKENKLIDDYFVFIIAPQKYLDENEEAKNYKNNISYEEILTNTKDDYSKSLLEKALDESKTGYIVDENQAVTNFWNYLYDYIEEKYNGLFKININRGPKGSRSFWPTFYTKYKSIKIIYKSNQGNVDIEFPKAASKISELTKAFINKGISNNEIDITRNSVVIRKKVDIVDFSEDFILNKERVDKALKTIIQLESLLDSKELYIDYKNIINE